MTHTILRDGAAILNPFDAYAVEEALRLREKLGGEITALSMGVPAAQRMLRDVLALGVDRAVLLTDRAFAGSDTLATATALSAAVRHLGGAGLILCLSLIHIFTAMRRSSSMEPTTCTWPQEQVHTGRGVPQ